MQEAAYLDAIAVSCFDDGYYSAALVPKLLLQIPLHSHSFCDGRCSFLVQILRCLRWCLKRKKNTVIQKAAIQK